MPNKTIATLTEDIYHLLDSNEKHTYNDDLLKSYGGNMSEAMAKATEYREGTRELGKMWASDLGEKCPRKSWYKWNKPECGDPFMGHTKFKFLYGSLLEEACLWLAEEAGHTVTHQQHRVEHKIDDWNISGRIDGIVDGVLIDVKSTSSYGFSRYKHGIDATNDSFGYIQQLGYYKHFGVFSDKIEERPGFIWIDKQNGHIKYTGCAIESRAQLESRTRAIIDACTQQDGQLVPRGYKPEPYGKSGNLALPIACSYCAFKRDCYKEANNNKGLRTFAYNHKPIDFTKIVVEPRVPEIHHDRD